MADVAVAERKAVSCAVCSGEVLTEGLSTCSLHVEHEIGITYRQLNHWVIRGYLRPDQERRSSGVARSWTAAELEVARRMGRLVRAGLTPERAIVFARDGWPSGEIGPGIRLEVRDGQ